MSESGNIKTVHFIRHGETLANRKSIHQGPDEPLSERGERQAREVAERIKELNIDTLVTSSLVRARETATIIEEVIGLPYEIMDEVVEFARPNFLYGRSHYSLASVLYVIYLYLNQSNPNWDNDGAENLFQIRNRIKATKDKLESMPGENILVVSHSIFMDMFRTSVCADRELNLSEFTRGLIFHKRVPNTGIQSYQVDSNAPQGTCRWWPV